MEDDQKQGLYAQSCFIRDLQTYSQRKLRWQESKTESLISECSLPELVLNFANTGHLTNSFTVCLFLSALHERSLVFVGS